MSRPRTVIDAADGALVGARVITLDPGRPTATAVAWRNGTIIAVGDATDVRDVIGPNTVVTDGSEMTITPGLVDSHVHPFHGTDVTRGVDLRGATTVGEIRLRLAAATPDPADGDWLLGHSMSYDAFGDADIHAALFDDTTAGRPLLLRFFDGHTDLANAPALAAAGISGPRTFDSSAQIVCDADGRPTGELRELAAMRLVHEVVPALTIDARLAAYARTLRAMNAVGLAGAHVMLGDRELLSDVAALEERGELTLRLAMPLRIEPEASEEQIERQLALAGIGGRRWTVRMAKFFLDGVIESGTAWLLEPRESGVNAASFWPDPARYTQLVIRFAHNGFVCVTHAIGDAAVRHALDAYALAGRPVRGHHRVEHIEMLADEDVPRFNAQGVAASMQPLHMEDVNEPGSAWAARLTPEQLRRGWRTADLERAGALLALGSDWMVAQYDPRIGMAWAQLRREPGRPVADPYLPHQALGPESVLRGYTDVPARILGDAAAGGAVAVGRQADLTGWGADPLTTTADELPQVPMLLTVVDGEIVHQVDP